MNLRLWCGVLLVFLPRCVMAQQHHETVLQSERFGPLHVVKSVEAPRRAIILFSGDDGWSPALAREAEKAAQSGYFVIGVDTPEYRSRMQNGSEDCVYIAGEIERLSQSVENGEGLKEYIKPILVGFSSGASVVYVALAQHHQAFVGGVMLSFCPTFELQTNFCLDDNLQSRLIGNGERTRIRLKPSRDLELNAVAIQGEKDTICSQGAAHSFFSEMRSVHYLPLRNTGHEVFQANDWGQRFTTALNLVFDGDSAVSETRPLVEEVSDLPVVEVLAEKETSDSFAIFLSGDGGWATIDKSVGEYLSTHGMNIIGFNSLKYFWKRRSPEETATDIARVMRVYAARLQKKKVVLIGFSMGAEVLPFIVNHLPQRYLKMVDRVILLAPETTADFEVHISGWIGINDASGRLPLAPEVERFASLPLLCLRGEDEDDTVCPELSKERATSVVLPGGHHFDGDYERVGSEIEKFLRSTQR